MPATATVKDPWTHRSSTTPASSWKAMLQLSILPSDLHAAPTLELTKVVVFPPSPIAEEEAVASL